MFEFESTFEERKPQSKISVVYDKRDGRIVHMHEFIGDDTGLFASDALETRERMAREAAARNGDPEHLRIMHAPAKFRRKPEVRYRVDLESGKLVTLRKAGFSHRELLARRRKTP